MLKSLFFDLDGTITDSGRGIKNSLKYALNKMGVRDYDEDVLDSFIGPPIKERGREVFGFSIEQSEKLLEFYREYFVVQGMYENEVYEGVENMLFALKKAGKTLIIATSKPEVHAKEILRFFGLRDYFDLIIGATLDGKISHKNDVIKEALKSANVDGNYAVMIGDRKYDMEGGKLFSMKTVGVTYGYGDYDELCKANADVIVNSVKELEKTLLEI